MMIYRHPQFGEPLTDGSSFILGDVQYPSGWLKTATTAEIQALGFSILPDPAPAEPTTYRISKADMYRRMTEAEADLLQMVLSNSSSRMQGIFNGASYVSTSDDYFPVLRAGIVAAIGEARADEILAPSPVLGFRA